jgi:hypothetical protein
MNRLKLIPHITSLERMKFSVAKGIAIVAVQPSPVVRASEVETPSQPDRRPVYHQPARL